ncbi:hypothetical protein BH23ACI1_BH23ACI1_27530 [soil metagenome]|nr:PepSY domain-containing protein [Acidobacteriota bacterium]
MGSNDRPVHFNVLNRKIHYWASFIVAVPVLIIILTGLLLQAKKHWTWVQPAERRGSSRAPTVSLDQVLASVRALPDLGVATWDDVNRMDVRPGRGIVKVWLQNGYEVQVDLANAEVLQVAYRRSELIESIHDGSFFGGDWVKMGLFLPAGLTLLLLWLGGMWMWWVPFIARRKRAKLRYDLHHRPANAVDGSGFE